MSFYISPLSITKVDWQVYSKSVQDIIGIDPLRGLGQSHISLENPSAYLSTLDFKNQPREHLKSGSNAFEHFAVSFIAQVEYSLISDVAIHTPLKLIIHDELAILTAHMQIWKTTIYYSLHKNSNKSEKFKRFFTHILLLFDNLGFKDVWAQYNRKVENEMVIFI